MQNDLTATLDHLFHSAIRCSLAEVGGRFVDGALDGECA